MEKTNKELAVELAKAFANANSKDGPNFGPVRASEIDAALKMFYETLSGFSKTLDE